MVKVIKRDGLEENFEKEKIIKVLIAAGLNAPDAASVAEKVSDWANTLDAKAIKSTDVADKVIEMLKDTNPYIADLFTWYEQTKLKT
jgi:transcriptional regulator NrdR family protein